MAKKRKSRAGQTAIQQPTLPPTSHYPWVAPSIRWLLYGTLFALPWIQFARTTSHSASYYFVELWLGGVLSILLLIGIWSRTLKLPAGKMWIPIGLWLASQLISTVVSIERSASFWGGYTTWSNGLAFAGFTLVGLLAFCTIEPDEKDYRFLINLLTFQAALLSIGVLNEAVGLGLFHNRPVRPTSIFQNSDYFLSYSLLVLPAAITATILAVKQKESWMWRATKILASFLIGISLFLTLPTQLQQILTHQHYAPASSAGLNTTPGPTSLGSQAAFLDDPSNTERFSLWHLGIAIGKQHQVLGAGLATEPTAFFSVYHQFTLPWDYGRNYTMSRAHNAIIEVFSDQGIVGLCTYFLLWISIFFVLVRAWKRDQVPAPLKPYALAAASGLLLYLGFNVFFFSTPIPELIAWLFVGIILLTSGAFQSQKALSSYSLIAVGILTLFSIFTGYGGARYLYAEQTDVLAQSAIYSNDALNAAALSSQAADIFTDNADYQLHAAAYSRAVYMLFTGQLNESQLQPYASKAVIYADRTPGNNPFYLLEQGLSRYAVNPLGTAESEKGDQLVQQALALGDRYPLLFAEAGDVYYWKGSCATALQYYQAAIDKHITPQVAQTITLKEATVPCVPAQQPQP